MSDRAAPRLVVVGSLNLDSVSEVPALPRPGETVLALRSARGLGGKRERGAIRCSSRQKASRTEITGQTPDSEHKTLGLGCASRSAVKIKRNISDERGAGDDDHRRNRQRGQNLH